MNFSMMSTVRYTAVPCHVQYRATCSTVPRAVPCHVQYRATCSTVPLAVPCHVQYRATTDATYRYRLPADDAFCPRLPGTAWIAYFIDLQFTCLTSLVPVHYIPVHLLWLLD
jgi:hypothetical protein